jgi:GT2 family glycosyltransferase
MNFDIDVIIVNYNLKKDTVECINSLLTAGIDLKNIILVDNASTDDSVSYITKALGPDLVVINSPVNRGYPYGLNLGIKKSLEREKNWFLLMNNDTVVDKTFFYILSDIINNKLNPKEKVIGPAILYYDEPEKIWFIGDTILPGTLITINKFRKKEYSETLPEILQVDFVHGCTMMVHREVIERIGFFDDTSLIYGDELDFCMRAKQADYKIIALPKVKMWHKISTIMKKHSRKSRYLRIRNQIRFYKKYSKGLKRLVMVVFTFLRSGLILLNDIYRGNKELITPLIYGYFDGWNDKPERIF